MAKYTVRKCVRCCPDGGAICDPTQDIDGKPIWVCRDCHCEMPRRLSKAPTKPSKTQARIAARMLELFGGTCETKMIGSKLWVTLVNEARPWFKSSRAFGTIGRKGKLDITVMRIGGDVKVTDRIGMEVYLKDD